MRKLGVIELDTFFPPADRTQLAMRLNGLLASPSFAAWAEGPPLDIESHARRRRRPARLRRRRQLAHLSDEERQFVVDAACCRRSSPGCDASRARPTCGR